MLVYRLDPAKATLVANDPPFAAIKPGSGPRHLAFHPSGRFVFLISEIGSTLTVVRLRCQAWGAEGIADRLDPAGDIHWRPLRRGGAGASFREVRVLLKSRPRQHRNLPVSTPRPANLTYVENQPTQGKTPRHFAIDPTGQWLLAENQDSDNVVIFRIDTKTGRLSPTGQTVSVGAPVCAIFAPVKQAGPRRGREIAGFSVAGFGFL